MIWQVSFCLRKLSRYCKLFVPYFQSCSTDSATFIHPESAMFDKLPEYVVYQEIVETSKLYLKGVTSIEEDWLAVFAPYKCSFSQPLESPQPYYDPAIGRIKCYMRSYYGRFLFFSNWIRCNFS